MILFFMSVVTMIASSVVKDVCVSSMHLVLLSFMINNKWYKQSNDTLNEWLKYIICHL